MIFRVVIEKYGLILQIK